VELDVFIDLKGQRFGRWTVVARARKKGAFGRWRCRCDCGTKRDVFASNLRNGKSSSCGCAVSNAERLRRVNRRLTDEQVLAIRDDSRTQVEIAREYGIAQSAISFIKSRRNWSHL